MRLNLKSHSKIIEKSFTIFILVVFIAYASPVIALDDISKSDLRKNALKYDRIVCGVDTAPETEAATGITNANGNIDIKKLDPPIKVAEAGGKIDPKAIVLHWWGSNPKKGIKPLADTLNQRDLSVQFGVTHEGEIWQMMKEETTRASHATGANETAFGIEIEGAGVSDFGPNGSTNNSKKFEAVSKLVAYLADKYSIDLNKRDAKCNNPSGLLSHTDFNNCNKRQQDGGGKTEHKDDVDEGYFQDVKKRSKELQGSNVSGNNQVSQQGAAANNSVYMMGDSITAGAKSQLSSALGKDYKIEKIDGVTSRSFTSPGTGTTNGLQAIDAGKAAIKKSGIVIIALGTNGDGGESKAKLFKRNAQSAIDKIKGYNMDAKIYWVKIFTTAPRIKHKSSYNNFIDSLDGVTPIDLNRSSVSLGDGVHPTAAGYKEYAKLIAAGLGPTSSSASENLSQREKIGQLMFVGATNNKQEMINIIKKYKIGGVMLTNESTSLYSKEAINELKAAAGGSLLIASDEEGGQVQRVGKQLKKGGYPSAKSLGKESPEEIEKIAREYGEKLFERGITVNYAPVADLDDGANDVISGNDRAFSSKPDTVAGKAGAFAKGMKAAGVTPVFKHFPGHGYADGDSHVKVVKTPSLAVLKKNDLKPYKTLLEDGGSGVMMGHLVVPGWTESDEKNQQTSINKKAYDLLRGEEYKFNGVVFTDEIANMAAIAKNHDPDEAVALAIRAGADMPLFNFNSGFDSLDQQVKKTIDKVEQYVRSYNIDIDESLKRISAIKGGGMKQDTKRVSEGCVCVSGSGSNPTAAATAKEAFDYFIGAPANFSPVVSAGIVGNLMNETGGNEEKLDPRAVSPDGAYTGIAQWDTPGRWAALKTYANKKGRDPYSFALQLEYIWHELKTEPFNGLAELKKATSAAQAAEIFDDRFERSSAGRADRMKNATRIFEKYGGDIKVSAPTVAGDTTGDSCVKGAEETGATTGEFSWPLAKQYQVTSCYGSVARGRLHSGIDIAAPRGTAIKAAEGGTVTFAGSSSGFGNTVVIKHTNGYSTLYAHQKDGSIKVKVGDKIDSGQAIGEVNNTGSSFGDHLHFNIQKQIVPAYAPDGSDTEDPLKHLPKDGRVINGGDC